MLQTSSEEASRLEGDSAAESESGRSSVAHDETSAGSTASQGSSEELQERNEVTDAYLSCFGPKQNQACHVHIHIHNAKDVRS